jgi:ATP synthase protein I
MSEKKKATPKRRKVIHDRFAEEIGRQEARKIRSEKETGQTVWFGLGMFGIVGWSVAIPTLIGTAFGIWIDHGWPSQYSWTLMLLVIGLALGCMNAWYWVKKGGISKDE